MTLSHDPRDYHGQGGRQDQTWGTTEGTLGDRREASQMVPSTGLFNGFQRADVSSQKGENGDSNAALPGNAQNRPLQDSRGGLFGITGGEQIIVPGTGKMGKNNQERSDST